MVILVVKINFELFKATLMYKDSKKKKNTVLHNFVDLMFKIDSNRQAVYKKKQYSSKYSIS